MKLLYITNGINGSGGLERVLSIKASYLVEYYNYDITILVLNNYHIEPFYEFSTKIKMVSIQVKGNAIKYIKSYCKGLVEVVNSENPDVISVCDDGLKGFFVPQIIKQKIPIIYERHASVNLNFNKKNSGFKESIQHKFEYFLMKFLSKYFDKFIVLTQGNLKEWTSNNLKVIPNPLSIYPLSAASLQNKKVIAVGSHSYNKGYDLLLLAWKIAIEKQPNWKLKIYGKIDDQNIFTAQARYLNLDAHVDFLDPVRDIEKAYLDASIMVLPSRSEGFGMVLIEAMACGLPCVSFDCPHGPADIITDNKDGFLVENGNFNNLAEKLIILMNDENLRLQMGTAAKENVKRYLPEVVIKQWDNLFESLVS